MHKYGSCFVFNINSSKLLFYFVLLALKPFSVDIFMHMSCTLLYQQIVLPDVIKENLNFK